MPHEIADGVMLVMVGNRHAGNVYETRGGRLRALSHEEMEALAHIPRTHHARRAARATWQDLDCGAEVALPPTAATSPSDKRQEQ